MFEIKEKFVCTHDSIRVGKDEGSHHGEAATARTIPTVWRYLDSGSGLQHLSVLATTYRAVVIQVPLPLDQTTPLVFLSYIITPNPLDDSN